MHIFVIIIYLKNDDKYMYQNIPKIFCLFYLIFSDIKMLIFGLLRLHFYRAINIIFWMKVWPMMNYFLKTLTKSEPLSETPKN